MSSEEQPKRPEFAPDRITVQLLKKVTFYYQDISGKKQSFTKTFKVSDSETILGQKTSLGYYRYSDQWPLKDDIEFYSKYKLNTNPEGVFENIRALIKTLASALEEGKYISGDAELYMDSVAKKLGFELEYDSHKAIENRNVENKELREEVERLRKEVAKLKGEKKK